MITVVIPTRNRADLLAPALESLTQQTLPVSEFEVLVVDNGSTDETGRVIAAYASRLPGLRGLYEPEPGLHTGRHAGAKAARGDILVFADDDIEAFPTWLESIAEVFRDQQIAMAGGNNVPRFLAPPPPWLQSLWNRRDSRGIRAIPALSVIEFPMSRGAISPGLVWGCNFPIRKKVLEEAGGFHPDGMPKDRLRFRGDGETPVSLFVAASGMRCEFHAGASVYHKVTPERMTYAYFRQRGFSQGISDSFAALRNKGQPHKRPTSLTKRVTGKIWRELRALTAGRDVREALRQLKLGRGEGYTFHQDAYREDAAVRAWVHQPHYWQGLRG